MDNKSRFPHLSLSKPSVPSPALNQQAQTAAAVTLRRSRHRRGDIGKRPGFMTAIIVQVGISMAEKQGLRSAAVFMLENNVNYQVIARVLFEPQRRRLQDSFALSWAGR